MVVGMLTILTKVIHIPLLKPHDDKLSHDLVILVIPLVWGLFAIRIATHGEFISTDSIIFGCTNINDLNQYDVLYDKYVSEKYKNFEHDRLVEYSQMAFNFENEKINEAIIQRNEAVKENSRMVDRHYKAIKERDKIIEELSEKIWQQEKQIMIMKKQNKSG